MKIDQFYLFFSSLPIDKAPLKLSYWFFFIASKCYFQSVQIIYGVQDSWWEKKTKPQVSSHLYNGGEINNVQRRRKWPPSSRVASRPTTYTKRFGFLILLRLTPTMEPGTPLLPACPGERLVQRTQVFSHRKKSRPSSLSSTWEMSPIVLVVHIPLAGILDLNLIRPGGSLSKGSAAVQGWAKEWSLGW